MYRVQTLNQIAAAGLARLPQNRFQVENDAEAPDAILVRSASLHEKELPDSLLAIARAGAGVNNIPLDRCSEKGIVVFNTPGANSGAVAELTIGALIMGSRNLTAANAWLNGLKGKDVDLAKEVEKGKKQFVGPELYGKKLGVIGLGAIGVKVANDANVAALGEKMFGAGKEYNDMVMITLGTGVGAGIIIDGKLFEGNRSAGAEIGHMLLVHGGEQCTCGRKGCFEAYSSATALIRDTRRAMQNHKDSLMWEIGSIDNVTGKTPFDYAKKDKYAAEVVNNYIEMLGSALTDIANIFRPEAIIIGGGVCAQGDNLIVPLKQKIQSELFGADFGSPEVVLRIAELGNKAGLLGAAALFM